MNKQLKTGTPVDLIMSPNVVSINDSASVADAKKLFKTFGVHKVVVTRGKDVSGLLEDWKILPGDETKKVGDLQLSTVPVTNSGSDVGDILGNLRDSPAVVVTRPNKEIAGVVTAVDLLKMKKLLPGADSTTFY